MGNIITAIVSVVTAVVSIATTVWNAISPVVNVVWGAISTVADVYNWAREAIGAVWDFIKPFYDWVKNNVWPYVQWCINQINQIYKLIDENTKSILNWVDSLYKSVFGRIYELWDRLTATEEKLVRLIGVVNKDLADKINKSWTELRAETLGRIEKVYAEIRKEIDKVRVEILQRIEVVRSFLNEKIVHTWNTLESFRKVAETIFEKEYTLRDETVKVTTRKYGGTLYREMFGTSDRSLPPFPIERKEEEEVYRELDIQIAELDLGEEGTWGDVELNISDFVEALDAGQDFPDLGLDLNLLSEDERKEMGGMMETAWDVVREETAKEYLEEETGE
jgi:hypothetical protein